MFKTENGSYSNFSKIELIANITIGRPQPVPQIFGSGSISGPSGVVGFQENIFKCFTVQIDTTFESTWSPKGVPCRVDRFLDSGNSIDPPTVCSALQSILHTPNNHIVFVIKCSSSQITISIIKNFIAHIILDFRCPDLCSYLTPPIPFKIRSIYFCSEAQIIIGQPFVDNIDTIAPHGKLVRIQGILGRVSFKCERCLRA